MKKILSYKFRKCSDVEMEYPYLEVRDQDEKVFMDISKNDDGEFQVLFYPEIASSQISLIELKKIFEEAEKQI